MTHQRKLSSFWLDFLLPKNAALLRSQFSLYRPNAKFAELILVGTLVRSDCCEGRVGLFCLKGLELSVKKVASGKFLAPAWKRASTCEELPAKRREPPMTHQALADGEQKCSPFVFCKNKRENSRPQVRGISNWQVKRNDDWCRGSTTL